MKTTFKTENYKSLSKLKRDCVYCYIMLEIRELTIQQLASKYDVSRALVCAWAKCGCEMYSAL